MIGTNEREMANRGPNVIIMSAAGKAIFVRYGREPGGEANEDEWSTACGIIQGLRANVLSFGNSIINGGFDNNRQASSPLGDIQSIKAGKRLVVFKHTDALTFVSISDRKDGYHNEAWLRLQLEYVYSQVVFTLTSQVQSIFDRCPGYDLRSMMGSNVNDSIRNLLDRFDPSVDDSDCDDSGSGCGCFLTAGIECVHPIPIEIREDASKMLLNSCGRSNTNDLFAMLVVGTRLVTIVQPANPSSQLHTSDLHLILTFVGCQTGLLTNELWFPLCLPRFDSSGFLYAYTLCLDPNDTGLSFVMISPDNSMEQFQSFREAANMVRKRLGLPTVKSKVLRVFNSSSPSNVSTQSDVDNGIGFAQEINEFVKRLSISTYLENSYDKDADEDEKRAHEAPLLTALHAALSAKSQEEMMASYLRIASAVHFCFRCDIYVNNAQSSGGVTPTTGSMLTQCFGPSLTFPFTDASSKSHVWDIYQRLALRLRLGSASVETTMEALDTISDTSYHQNQYKKRACGISNECPMQLLLESPPKEHSVTYVVDEDYLYVGLNGKFFELYATLPATIPPKTGTALCARLVKSLMGDERILFLSNPITWGS